jgi:hypothetical protein
LFHEKLVPASHRRRDNRVVEISVVPAKKP